MYLNDFSVRVPEGKEVPGGYIELAHNTQYTLVLRNNRNTKCDARVEIGGKHVGTFRIGMYGSLRLERPSHDDGRFTFYRVGTPEAAAVEPNQSAPDVGLVKVTFTPGKRIQIKPVPKSAPVYRHTYYTSNTGDHWGCSTLETDHLTFSGTASHLADSSPVPCQAPPSGSSAGVTGLSGKSNQSFFEVANLDYDYTKQTTIHLRLVCMDDGPRPLTATSNPIPPRPY